VFVGTNAMTMVYDPRMIARVLRNALWLGVGEAVVKGGLVVATVLIARGWGPTGVGNFSVAYSAAMIAILVMALGQQEVLIREVARSSSSARTLLDRSAHLQFRLMLWVVPAALLAALAVADRELRLALFGFAPYAILRTATVTGGAVFKGLDRMDVEARARGLEIGLAVAIIGAGLVFEWPSWSTAAAFSSGSAIGFVWIAGRFSELEREPTSLQATFFFREGLPFMALSVVGQLLVYGDRFLLALLGVESSEIGYWGVAGTVVWSVVAIPQLASLALYPGFSRIAEDGGSPRRLGLGASVGGAVVGVIAAVLLRWFAQPLVGLVFGVEFLPAAALLERLALALPGASAMMVMGSVYAAWRRQVIPLAVLGGALTLSVTLNVIWIPRFGAFATATIAAVAYSAAALVLTLIVLWLPPASREQW
jgi:O-antigen/teichoic acid export membrane protein